MSPPETHQQSLDAGWQFLALESGDWRAATVPGVIHTDLLAHGLIPDPFYGTNELGLQWIGERDWTYQLTFAADDALFQQEQIDLLCDGLDTVAVVTLNGDAILESSNMFHRHRVSVTNRLRRGVNTLRIEFQNAFAYMEAHKAKHAHREGPEPVKNRARIRKCQSHFGWDWGPAFVTCGIWQPVFLEGWSVNRIETIAVAQIHQNGQVRLRLTPELAIANPLARFRATVSLDGETAAFTEGGAQDMAVTIVQPRLWWPAGQGEQALYDLRVELLHGGSPIAEWQRRIGLRTITLDMEADGFDVKSGSERPLNRFGFRVNGRLVFAKGANWIPGHSFLPSQREADYRRALQSAADAHMNMVRVWGGGVYEADLFYDLCDEMGLLVWQDFMFACTRYPADAGFCASVRREARENVTRLRHHASLALWCGNNEIAHCCPLDGPEEYRTAYAAIFLDVLPSVVQELNLATSYIHASPAYAIEGLPASHLPSQDDHDWNVFHARKPVEYYETTRLRFASEFGMQSYPSVPVAETFCPPGELNVLSPVFENHQKSAAGNGVILHYTVDQFRFPRDYQGIAYLSQLNQAYCVQAAVEHFRRQQPQCLGALYWQLNDCWPVSSWSSLEFGGRWKALHYYARRFFAPHLVSIKRHGRDWAGTDNRRENTRGIVDIYTVCDAPQSRRARLAWELCALNGQVVSQGERNVVLEYGASVIQETLDFTAALAEVGKANASLHARLRDADSAEELSRSIVEFVPPRFLNLGTAPISVISEWRSDAELWLTLSADDFKYGVCIEQPGGALVSDNYFDLCPGETRTVTVTYPQAQIGTSARLPLIYSLVDTYR